LKVFSYWSGPLSWMERLSVATATATGHELTIYSYQPQVLRSEQLGVEVVDAREVFFDPALDRMDSKLPDHFSDHFRAEGLAKSLGVWVDLDIAFVRTLPSEDHLLCWQEPNCVCGAVLALPAESPFLSDYLDICRRRPVSVAPPWFPLHERLRLRFKHFRRQLAGRPGVALPYGPPALTHLASKHGLLDRVLPSNAFFPVHWSQVMTLFKDDSYRPSVGTYSVHLWRNVCGKLHGNPQPEPSSWLGRLCSAHDVKLQ
jgi:hypothetical protein